MEKCPKKEFINVGLQQKHDHTLYFVYIYIFLIAPDPVTPAIGILLRNRSKYWD
jgi:hypothetical protein